MTMRFDSPVWRRCLVTLCFVVASCAGAPGEADMDDMQTALWRAQQAVQGEQAVSLILPPCSLLNVLRHGHSRIWALRPMRSERVGRT